MFMCQNAEGYMVTKRMETPGLGSRQWLYARSSGR